MNHSLIDDDGKCDSEFPEVPWARTDVINLSLCNKTGCENCPYSEQNQAKMKDITSRLRLLMID